MKKIGILGSTGSIGSSAISLIKNELKEKVCVSFLSFHFNAELALQQAIAVKTRDVFATSKEGYQAFKKIYDGNEITLHFGDEALIEACKNEDLDVILLAIVGVYGLKFALSSISSNKKRTLAIANKEAIICGSHLINENLKNSKTKIIPVDSEHNSLFRLLSSLSSDAIEGVFITASGGPFLGRKFEDLKDVSLKDVVKHPVWSMGAKISVDSATMANKGLELIEASKLFNIKASKIKAFVCKGSTLHAGINLHDGASVWFLSKPDMKNHISHAILEGGISKLNLPRVCPLELSSLTFQELKKDEFPVFFIAKNVAESEDLSHIISFNILNEIAVAKFLNGEIKYTQILEIIDGNLGSNNLNYKFQNLLEIEDYSNYLAREVEYYLKH
jgi:1-deoxy-D-xylulose-5-phosphate reductoisomerase